MVYVDCVNYSDMDAPEYMLVRVDVSNTSAPKVVGNTTFLSSL